MLKTYFNCHKCIFLHVKLIFVMETLGIALFLLWLLWLKLSILCWIKWVRGGSLVLFLNLVGKLSDFHCLEWFLLFVINGLYCAEITPLMAESKEELKNLLMKVKKESEKAGLKFSIQKSKIVASGSITSWKINREKNENSNIIYFLGLQNYCRLWLRPWN